jgi:hypothetical protein
VGVIKLGVKSQINFYPGIFKGGMKEKKLSACFNRALVSKG